MCGDLVTGTVAASYGGYQTAVFETWRRATADEWHIHVGGPGPTYDDWDWNDWTIEGLPQLGGEWYYYEGPAALTGVRIMAPPKDPRVFFENPDEDSENGPDPKAERPRSSRRENRFKSCRRYDWAREANDRQGGKVTNVQTPTLVK